MTDDSTVPTSPFSQKPRARLAFAVLGVLVALWFVSRGVMALRDGATYGAWGFVSFWGLVLIANGFGIRRAVRGIRDPDGEWARERARYRAIADKPRAVALPRAALSLVGLVLACTGLIMLSAEAGPAAVAGAIAVVGVGAVLIGNWLLRRPPRHP